MEFSNHDYSMAVTFKDGVILGLFSPLQGVDINSPNANDSALTYRRRLPNNDGGLHRQPSDGQVDTSPRHDLVLPLRLGG